MPNEDKSKQSSWSADAKNLGVEKIAEQIYQDGLKGGVQELGKGIKTIGEAINAALFPIRGVVWSYEQIEKLIKKKLAEKLKGIDPEQIQQPPINVAGPALEALRFVGDEPSLQEMFANLLASSMDKGANRKVHPAFVEIIKQLSPIEAQLLMYVNKKYNLNDPKISVKFTYRDLRTGSEQTEEYEKLLDEVTQDLRAGSEQTKEYEKLLVEVTQALRGSGFGHWATGRTQSFSDAKLKLPVTVIVNSRHNEKQLSFDAIYDNFQNEFSSSEQSNKILFSRQNLSNLIRLEIFGIQSISTRSPFDEEDNFDYTYSTNTIDSKLFVTEFGKAFIETCVT